MFSGILSPFFLARPARTIPNQKACDFGFANYRSCGPFIKGFLPLVPASWVGASTTTPTEFYVFGGEEGALSLMTFLNSSSMTSARKRRQEIGQDAFFISERSFIGVDASLAERKHCFHILYRQGQPWIPP